MPCLPRGDDPAGHVRAAAAVNYFFPEPRTAFGVQTNVIDDNGRADKK
jgi:hypothetical protein